MKLGTAIQQLHDRCAVYTSGPTAARLLDLVGWTPEADLLRCTLLEPCVGEGAILLEGARRLIACVRAQDLDIAKLDLTPRIRGFEFHQGAARSAKISLRRLLIEENVGWDMASALAEAWVSERDFLLEAPLQVSHVVANPPYVRWAKLPAMLAANYREALPSTATRGDLSVAFLHRMQEWASDGGSIAALVSDRWMYAQYGEQFVSGTMGRGWSIDVVDERPLDPFVRDVGAYSAIVLLTRDGAQPRAPQVSDRARAKQFHRALVERYGTLGDAGCKVRVGPALGAGRTFIVEPGEAIDVEPELVRPFVNKQDLAGNEVTASGRRVVLPYDRQGKLIDLDAWPRFARWVERRRDVLQRRSQFVDRGDYWRTIDAVPAQWSAAPKLLLPELSNAPRTTIDRSLSIPAHSIYAIWSEAWPIDVLQKVLDGGLLNLTARAEAPTLKLGWMRFYKRFIMRTPLPKWSALSFTDQRDLAGSDFSEAFVRIFGFPPGGSGF